MRSHSTLSRRYADGAQKIVTSTPPLTTIQVEGNVVIQQHFSTADQAVSDPGSLTPTLGGYPHSQVPSSCRKSALDYNQSRGPTQTLLISMMALQVHRKQP
jgi:hypothetical protein